MQIIIDDIPPSLNRFAGRQNAWEYREYKETWTELVALKSRRSRPQRPFNKSVVTITYRFPDKRRRDPDNYCGKMILDGLTAAGIISDDSFHHIELRLRAERETGKKRTTIEVEEVREE